ncbi:MAG TPA: prolyl oligopeptidase family serine peptidase [Pirellulales bacterium]|jgi:acetyl esterase/lipase|nr:prolyl oligopeptidase family serine peptidase [Pirellulales bacterium]
MKSRPRLLILQLAILIGGLEASATPVHAQSFGAPDRDSPGDAMIQEYLRQETEKISARLSDDTTSLADWEAKRPQHAKEYAYMLGLSPLPEKTPLDAKITGAFKGDGYVVEMLHYQSRPRLYVTGNLYRPSVVEPGKKLPAILYVCGHSGRGRNGNKVAYQSHGIWFARHGYICLVVDTVELGEIASFHHGTYSLERWWWHSRGYTPAGVEAWNGVRGVDYLIGRPDVDPQRIAVTGISGGGAATFWIAALDERIKVAVPVSGMADLESYVPNRTINRHCDCMFIHNTFQWPWTRIAGLIAPRALLFVNSDHDVYFPMDANERVINRLKRLYSLYGASDQVDAVVSVGEHAYRRDIRQASFRFINAQLKGDARPVLDTEVDLVSEGNDPGSYPIAPERLRVFPADADLPSDSINKTIDEQFVPIAKVPAPEPGKLDDWKRGLVDELRRVSFGYFPDTIPAARRLADIDKLTERMQSEQGIEFRLRYAEKTISKGASSVLLVVLNADEAGTTPDWSTKIAAADQAVVYCEPRGIGATRWTRKNPPNYVERSHALLGRTVDTGRVWDVAAAAKYLSSRSRSEQSARPAAVEVAGKGAAGLIAAYAAIWTPEIARVTLVSPPTTHMDSTAPQFLNVLRICDVPEALGLVAPRPLTIVGSLADRFTATSAAYQAGRAQEHLKFQ